MDPTMLTQPSPPPDASQPLYRRLKLVVSTPEHQQGVQSSAYPHEAIIKQELSRSTSPARPSYSPVTPTLSQSSANAQDVPEPDWIDEPAPLPVSLDDNPDAIALQATLSLLQMQRQQSLRDIRALNKIRQSALEDPQAFVSDLKTGKLSKAVPAGISLDPDSSSSDEDDGTAHRNESAFGKLPVAQNIARCPPIEWSKYRIAGDSLDRLHKLQRKYPGVTEEALAQGFEPQPHEVAAPYRPFTDKLEASPSSMETRNYDK